MEKQFTLKSTDDNMEVYTNRFPDYDNLSKAEKRILLLPLVESIREYYDNPESKKNFETWKAKFLHEASAETQGFL